MAYEPIPRVHAYMRDHAREYRPNTIGTGVREGRIENSACMSPPFRPIRDLTRFCLRGIWLPKPLRYWTVARTNWREELRAAHHVERQGFEFYLPKMYEPRAGGDDEKQTLFFPGHIFIRLRDGWECLCNTRGIQRLFMVPPSYDRPDEFVPARLRDDEVSYLKSLQDDNEVCRLPPIPNGTSVLVKPGLGGAYDGITGIVAGTTARGRVEILLRILGRDFKREFSRSALQAA